MRGRASSPRELQFLAWWSARNPSLQTAPTPPRESARASGHSSSFAAAPKSSPLHNFLNTFILPLEVRRPSGRIKMNAFTFVAGGGDERRGDHRRGNRRFRD